MRWIYKVGIGAGLLDRGLYLMEKAPMQWYRCDISVLRDGSSGFVRDRGGENNWERVTSLVSHTL